MSQVLLFFIKNMTIIIKFLSAGVSVGKKEAWGERWERNGQDRSLLSGGRGKWMMSGREKRGDCGSEPEMTGARERVDCGEQGVEEGGVWRGERNGEREGVRRWEVVWGTGLVGQAISCEKGCGCGIIYLGDLERCNY